ncbi:MAG: TRAP transporter small permease subunit, partial [Methylobacteriaceae bacterium]|nr:TRAP transporter small permease subunit [Methylobacteriaceae bacterium]
MSAFADRALRGVAALLLLSLLATVFFGVVSRQIGAPLAWSDELAQYLLVWTGFAGWMIASRNRSHIRITVLTDRMPGRLAGPLEAATQIIVALFGAALIWHSISLIRRNWDVESIALPVTAAFLYLPVPLLGATLILQSATDAAAAL